MASKKVTNGLLAAGVAAGGILGAGVSMVGAGAESSVSPLTASVQQQDETTSEETSESRGSGERIAEALAPLVDDGTITQSQADAVAEQLTEAGGERWRKRGHHRFDIDGEVLETTLGLSADELREQLKDGSTVAEIAESQGVSVEELSTALVDEATERIDEKVEDGSLTQERADELLDELPDRVTDRLNGEGFLGSRRGR